MSFFNELLIWKRLPRMLNNIEQFNMCEIRILGVGENGQNMYLKR